jgi:hypothetical protein
MSVEGLIKRLEYGSKLRAGQGILAVSSAVDPIAPTCVVLEPEIVAHVVSSGSRFHHSPNTRSWAVGALHPPAHAAPGEGRRRVIR